MSKTDPVAELVEQATRVAEIGLHGLSVVEILRLIGSLADALSAKDREIAVLNEIGEALESRGYVHMTNGKSVGQIIDRLESAERELSQLKQQLAGETERCARIAEEPIAEYEDMQQGWRVSFGENAAQPYDDEITVRRQIAAAIRSQRIEE